MSLNRHIYVDLTVKKKKKKTTAQLFVLKSSPKSVNTQNELTDFFLHSFAFPANGALINTKYFITQM